MSWLAYALVGRPFTKIGIQKGNAMRDVLAWNKK